MKIGLIYPQNEMAGDPAAVARFGRAAEEMGYAHLGAFDHVLGGPHDGRAPALTGPYTEHDPFHDPFMLFAYLAPLTSKLEFVSAVLLLPQRQATLVARQAADLDLFSGGRLRMGIGTGWNYLEYQALNVDYAVRGRRLDEQVEVLKRLWTGELVSFDGAFHHIARLALNPKPSRQIPLWFGGYNEPAFRRAVRVGDGFIYSGGLEVAERGWKRVAAMLDEAGRDQAGFGRDLLVWPEADPMATRDLVLRWRDAGGTHASIATMKLGLVGVEQHIAYAEKVKRLLDA